MEPRMKTAPNRKRTVVKQLWRIAWRTPLWSIPTALFFGTLFGDRGWPSWVSSIPRAFLRGHDAYCARVRASGGSGSAVNSLPVWRTIAAEMWLRVVT